MAFAHNKVRVGTNITRSIDFTQAYQTQGFRMTVTGFWAHTLRLQRQSVRKTLAHQESNTGQKELTPIAKHGDRDFHAAELH